MRFHAKHSRRELSKIAVNLTTMIDVVFLLLIYFLVTMILATPEDKLSSTIQMKRDDSQGAAEDFQPQVIEVANFDGAPGFRLGTQVFRTRDELTAALAPLPKVAGVFINVSDEAPVGFVAAAMQAARDADFDQVTYVPES